MDPVPNIPKPNSSNQPPVMNPTLNSQTPVPPPAQPNSPNNANSTPPVSSPPPIPQVPPVGIRSVTIPPSQKRTGLPKVMLLLVLLVLIAVASIGFFYWKNYLNKPEDISKQPITLTYWGLWEPKEVIQPIFDEYQKANPNITINYINSSPNEYSERLRNAINSETPPDIFRIHNTWTRMYPNLLSRVPANVYTPDEFKSTFYPVASQDLTVGGQLVGVPLMFDGLALYYNVDLFNRAGVQPPSDWDQFVNVSQALTARADKTIQTAGASIGSAKNIDHWQDILSLLIIQNGGNPVLLSGPQTQNTYDALTFYSLFSYKYNVWDTNWPMASEQFAMGKVGMFFGPSWQVFNIKKIAQNNNVNLNFKIIPVPQLPDTNVTWASYWVETVSSKSPNQQAAWNFVKYLSQKETMQKMFNAQSQIREFGEIPSRRDMAEQFLTNEYIAPYLNQAEAAKSFPLVSSTTDKNGINDKLSQYYKSVVDLSSTGSAPDKAFKDNAQGIQEVAKTYGLQ